MNQQFLNLAGDKARDLYIPTSGWIPAKANWPYVSADAPSYVVAVPDIDAAFISVGNRVQCAQPALSNFIVTAKGTPASGMTPVTLYGGTDYSLVADTPIYNPFYSPIKSPYAFPLDETKWTILISNSSNCAKTTPSAATWYGGSGLSPTGPSIDIHIGAWKTSYKAFIATKDTTVTDFTIYSTLSTANNSESDSDFTAGGVQAFGTALTLQAMYPVFVEKTLVLAAKTTYYLNIKSNISTADNIQIRGDLVATSLKAICRYL